MSYCVVPLRMPISQDYLQKYQADEQFCVFVLM